MDQARLAALAVLALAAGAASQASPLLVDARKAPLPLVGVTALRIHRADLDGDGRLDTVVSCPRDVSANQRPSESLLLRDRGEGRFVEIPTPSPPLGLGPIHAVLDFDGDGDFDLLWEEHITPVVYANDGAAGFQPVASVPAFTGHAVVAGDVDGDRRPDVVIAGDTYVARPVSLFLSNASGPVGFTAAGDLPIGPVQAPSLVLEDLDGDGDLDLFLGLPGADRLLANNGRGGFTDVSATTLPPLTGNTATAHAFDQDNDGDLDLLLGERDAADVLLVNNGGVFQALPAALPPSADRASLAFASGDVDADGDVDLVRGGPDGVELWLRQGPAYVVAAAGAVPGEGGVVTALSLSDADRDGDLDLLVGRGAHPFLRGHDLPLQMLYNDGTGTFAGAPIETVRHESRHLAAGDFDLDGDGLTDIVQVTADAVSVWLNFGAVFPVRQRFAWPNYPNETIDDVALGDLDGDGDVDCYLSVTAAGSSAQDGVLRNDGSGTFTLIPATGPATFGGPVATADLDRDLDVDVVIGAAILINNGGGSFVRGAAVAHGIGSVTEVVLEDLDADGGADIVLCIGPDPDGLGMSDSVVAWNDATPTFGHRGTLNVVPSSPLAGTAGLTVAVAAGDLDGNGLLDLVFARDGLSTEARDTAVFVQDSLQTFRRLTEAEFARDDDFSSGVLVFDADRDADPDMLVVNPARWPMHVAPTRLYLNTTLQLRTPYTPRAGTTYEIEMHGAHAGAALLLSPAGNVTFPTPFGVFGLAPAATIFAATLPPAAPTSALALALPRSTTLVGTTLYWQALDAASLRLTNVVHDTVIGN